MPFILITWQVVVPNLATPGAISIDHIAPEESEEMTKRPQDVREWCAGDVI